MATLELLQDLLAQIIRVGFVSGRDPAKCRVRVRFEDTAGGETVSDWLPVLLPRAKDDEAFDLPDIGDQALCVFLPVGRESGFALGCMYGAGTPPAASGDKWHRKFKDGTWLEYDRAAHALKGSVRGEVELEADKSVAVKAGVDVKAEAGRDITARAGGSVMAGRPRLQRMGRELDALSFAVLLHEMRGSGEGVDERVGRILEMAGLGEEQPLVFGKVYWGLWVIKSAQAEHRQFHNGITLSARVGLELVEYN